MCLPTEADDQGLRGAPKSYGGGSYIVREVGAWIAPCKVPRISDPSTWKSEILYVYGWKFESLSLTG